MKNPKKVAKKGAVVSFIVLISVALLIVLADLAKKFLNMDGKDIIEVVISLLEAVGLVISLFVAVRQLGDSKEIARAQFVMELNESFVENEQYVALYNALQDCLDHNCDMQAQCEQSDKCLLPFTKGAVSNYLTFFETIYLLKRDGVLSFAIIDNLFGYRFFLAAHSRFVQETKLVAQPENFVNIYKLEAQWLEYRISIGKEPKPGSVYATRKLADQIPQEQYQRIINMPDYD
ncbi:MAG: hypothetical protein IJV78_01175 [Clostridia bacterium]|nr:hypothetical protein [Clostridia bacterium]MBQ8772116.1 hypothetical protein [Clostridia bacterium]MBQ8873634.1 hypothetical protein [Clostridia bacterium]MBQ9706486.1 hypothetical protein [Clostridia bacterium]